MYIMDKHRNVVVRFYCGLFSVIPQHQNVNVAYKFKNLEEAVEQLSILENTLQSGRFKLYSVEEFKAADYPRYPPYGNESK